MSGDFNRKDVFVGSSGSYKSAFNLSAGLVLPTAMREDVPQASPWHAGGHLLILFSSLSLCTCLSLSKFPSYKDSGNIVKSELTLIYSV